MSGTVRWRVLSVAALLVLFGFLVFANFVPKNERVESGLWPDNGLRLGLDLKGGIHWVVGVQLDSAITRELEFVRRTIEEQLEEAGITLVAATVEDLELRMTLASETDRNKALAYADDSGVLASAEGSGLDLRFRLTENWTEDVRERTMSQVLEV
ncbi:MAG: hypothetical protein VCB25_11100, partial [Myxococcota bacterium]